MLTQATKKYRDVLAFGLLGVAALIVISGFSLLLKSEDDLAPGIGFAERAVAFGPLFTSLALAGSLVLAVVVATAGEASKNAKAVTLAALAIGGLALLLALITWFAGYGVDDPEQFGFGGVSGAGKLVGTLVTIAAVALLGLAVLFIFAVLQAFPKRAAAQQQWGQAGAQSGGQPWGQQWGQQGGQPGAQPWGEGYAAGSGWGDQTQAQAQQQGQPAAAWGQAQDQPTGQHGRVEPGPQRGWAEGPQQAWGEQGQQQAWGEQGPQQAWGEPGQHQAWGQQEQQPAWQQPVEPPGQHSGQRPPAEPAGATKAPADPPAADETQVWGAEQPPDAPDGEQGRDDDQPPPQDWWQRP